MLEGNVLCHVHRSPGFQPDVSAASRLAGARSGAPFSLHGQPRLCAQLRWCRAWWLLGAWPGLWNQNRKPASAVTSSTGQRHRGLWASSSTCSAGHQKVLGPKLSLQPTDSGRSGLFPGDQVETGRDLS